MHYYVGGATKLYGAALYRLRREDFGELRHHDGLSPAWPVPYEDFEPYYTQAEHLYQVHGARGEDPTEPAASAGYPHPAVSHEPRIQQLSDDVLAGAFVTIAVLPDGEPALGVLAFGLAGLGCSALLPLTISFGQEELEGFAAATAGGVIAFYQVGFGIAAFGIGPLLAAGVGLSTIYALSAGIALLLGAWSLAVARRRPSPGSLHPYLGHAGGRAS